ncbi:hypothetical protein L1987_14956 [Smallanthus sonchifolius]|uniref:Uncharacterized protein n=1 Tax=Smallanthus sonchifolius TaxID=185202 RepID=A0ACB9J4S3_9ASTR|nr:hypothetical protein L1987_14956 [Smallanthus sonchifolius]
MYVVGREWSRREVGLVTNDKMHDDNFVGFNREEVIRKKHMTVQAIVSGNNTNPLTMWAIALTSEHEVFEESSSVLTKSNVVAYVLSCGMEMIVDIMKRFPTSGGDVSMEGDTVVIGGATVVTGGDEL